MPPFSGQRGRALLGHAHERARGIARHLVAAPAGQIVTEPGRQQHAVGQRRVPRDLLHPLEPVLVGGGFGRRRRRAAPDEVVVLGLLPAAVGGRVVGGAGARLLLVPVDVELVARRGLVGQAHAGDVVAGAGARLARGVGFVEPARRARVLVGEHARDRRMRSLVAQVQEVPQPVALDRPAQPQRVVPQLQQLARHAQPRRTQLVAVVVAHHAAGDVGEIHRAAQLVAAGLGHDAERRARDLGFAEAGGDREGDFLRVGDVGVVARHAAAVARRADAQAIHLQPALVAVAPAWRAEDHHAGRRLDVGRRRALGLDGRHQQHHAGVAARGRDAGQDVARDRRLTGHALDVHDRRLAGDGDGFFHRADAQVGVHAGGQRSGQLDAVTLDGRKPRQGERHRIGAGPQVDDAVEAGAVGHGRAHLLDEHGARGFDGDAGQNGPRRVADHARDRGLGGCQGGGQENGAQREDEPGASLGTHGGAPPSVAG